MMTDRIKLNFIYSSQSADDKTLTFFTYADEAKERMLVVPVSETACRNMKAYMDGNQPAGDFVGTLYRIFSDQEYIQHEIEIYNVKGTEYLTRINNTLLDKSYAVKCEDALLWAYISKSPVFIDRTLMKVQSAPYSDNGHLALPIYVVPIKLLEKSLEKAVKEENYEYASAIRDEIKRRQEVEADKE